MKNEPEEEKDLSGVEFAWESLYRENAELRQIVAEFIPMMEEYKTLAMKVKVNRGYEIDKSKWIEEIESVISRAKSLLETKMKEE